MKKTKNVAQIILRKIKNLLLSNIKLKIQECYNKFFLCKKPYFPLKKKTVPK
jgi:hypothetical protein